MDDVRQVGVVSWLAGLRESDFPLLRRLPAGNRVIRGFSESRLNRRVPYQSSFTIAYEVTSRIQPIPLEHLVRYTLCHKYSRF